MSTDTMEAFMRTMYSPARVAIKHTIGGIIYEDISGLGVSRIAWAVLVL